MSVYIEECDPRTRARVLEQLSGTDGGTAALAHSKREVAA